MPLRSQQLPRQPRRSLEFLLVEIHLTLHVPASKALALLLLFTPCIARAQQQQPVLPSQPPPIPAAIQALIDLRKEAEDRAAFAMQRVYVLQEQVNNITKTPTKEVEELKQNVKTLEREIEGLKAERMAESKNLDEAHDIITKGSNCPQPSQPKP